MPIYRLGNLVPEIHPESYVHPEAVVVGAVRIEQEASVWPGAVLRGDFGRIEVGAGTSIQDNCVIHAAEDWPTIVGRECVIAHLVHLEGCTIEDGVLVGSASHVLRGAVVRTGAIVAAGALVLGDKEVPAGSRAQGVPAELVPNTMTAEDVRAGAEHYRTMAKRYTSELTEIIGPITDRG